MYIKITKKNNFKKNNSFFFNKARRKKQLTFTCFIVRDVVINTTFSGLCSENPKNGFLFEILVYTILNGKISEVLKTY